MIGAGSVVTKDVPAGEVWYGNPARFIRRIATGGGYNCRVEFSFRHAFNINALLCEVAA